MKNVKVGICERFADGFIRQPSADCDVPAGSDALGWAMAAGGAVPTPHGYTPVLVEFDRLRIGDAPRATVLVSKGYEGERFVRMPLRDAPHGARFKAGCTDLGLAVLRDGDEGGLWHIDRAAFVAVGGRMDEDVVVDLVTPKEPTL